MAKRLSAKARNALHAAMFEYDCAASVNASPITDSQYLDFADTLSDRQLLIIPGCGKKTAQEIRAARPRRKFRPASDDELRAAGWDPQWIVRNQECDGPYAVAAEKDAVCPCCSGTITGWTVVNLATATGIGISWTHKEAQVDAAECASQLNAVWLEGYAAAIDLNDLPPAF